MYKREHQLYHRANVSHGGSEYRVAEGRLRHDSEGERDGRSVFTPIGRSRARPPKRAIGGWIEVLGLSSRR